jgi:3-oxoacyl-(acyl-carrier-protein) synthase
MTGTGLSILGAGCVTALGRGWESVWEKILAGESPSPVVSPQVKDFPSVATYPVAVPDAPAPVAARPRRSSAISYFACAAAADAIAQAGPLSGPTALIFAASDGAVTYTRRFYEDVVARGTGSPLLFPETVYNASASHMAAMLGWDGAVLTLVNDATAGLDALETASLLIASGEARQCLVVASEELDGILCEGYRRWKMTRKPGTEGPGAVLSEGAAALVVGPAAPGDVQIARVQSGRMLPRHAARRGAMRQALAGIAADVAVLSGSGAWTDAGEEAVVRECFPAARLIAPKRVAGEVFAVSSLLQCLCAWEALRQGPARTAIVPVAGWSGQFGAALLGRAEDLLAAGDNPHGCEGRGNLITGVSARACGIEPVRAQN